MKILSLMFAAVVLAGSLCAASADADTLAPKSAFSTPKPRKGSHRIVERRLSDELLVYTVEELGADIQGHDAQQIIRRYSQYKFGSPILVEHYGERIAEMIGRRLGPNLIAHPENYVIVTPPYTSLVPAVQALGDCVAAELGVTRVVLRAHPSVAIVADYSGLRSQQEREDANEAIEFDVENNYDLRGKRVVFLDDMINTGTTLLSNSRKLKEKYGVVDITAFGILSLRNENLHLESWINANIMLSRDVEALASILNHPRAVVNKFALRNILHTDPAVLEGVVSRLSDNGLARLVWSAHRYYQDAPLPAPFSNMEHVLNARGLFLAGVLPNPSSCAGQIQGIRRAEQSL